MYSQRCSLEQTEDNYSQKVSDVSNRWQVIAWLVTLFVYTIQFQNLFVLVSQFDLL